LAGKKHSPFLSTFFTQQQKDFKLSFAFYFLKTYKPVLPAYKFFFQLNYNFMKTIIVPVDFSRTSINTANYAVKMLTGQHDTEVILYHAYEKSTEADQAQELMEELKQRLSSSGITNAKTHIEESGDFPEALSRFARHHAAQLIIMGLTGKSKLAQMFLTGKTLKIVDKNPLPGFNSSSFCYI